MLQLIMVLVAFGAIAGTLYALWKPHWVFVLILVMFPVKQLLLVSVPMMAANHLFFNFTVGLLALVAVMARFSRQIPLTSGLPNAATVFTISLYLLWWVGIIWSPSRDIILGQISSHASYQFLLLIVLPLLVYDLHEFRKMTTGFMVVGTIIAVLIIINPNSSFHGGRLKLDIGMLGDRTGFGNPLVLAEMGGFLALIAALVVPPSKTAMYTVIRIAAFMVGMGLAIGSGSRGQVLAAGIAGVLFFPMARKLSNPRQFFIGAIAFGAIITGLIVVFNIAVTFQNRDRWDLMQMFQDTLLRLDMVDELFAAYISSPVHWLLGLGTGFYASISPDPSTLYCHNVAADALCEHGLLGFIFFVGAGYFAFKYSRRMWLMYRDDPTHRAAATILIAGGLYYLLLSLKQGQMAFPQPAFWWLVMAKLGRHEMKMAEEYQQSLAEMDLPEFSDADDDYGYATPPAQPALG